MKRALSLVLAAALVLGSVPAGFAATSTAGETLKGYGLVAGDTNGNLNEDKTITRGEMMVVLARLLGKFEEAKAYSIPSTSKDVAGHWAANYIAYAEKEGWTAGKGNGMFDPQGTVTLQEVSVFMLKALGYTADWNTAVKAATDLGLLKEVVATDAAAKVLRSDVFTSALNTINTPVKDSTVKLGEKLGVLKPVVVAEKVDVKSAVALNSKVVEVALNTAIKTVDAKAFTVKDAAGAAIAVTAASLAGYDTAGKTVLLTLEKDTTAGTLYTLTAEGKNVNFGGKSADTTKPTVTKVESVDYNQVKVVFSEAVKLESVKAAFAKKYADKAALATTAVAYDGADTLVFTTADQADATLYGATIEAAADLAGNVMDKDDAKTFIGTAKSTADQTVKSAKALDYKTVYVEFGTNLDAATLVAANFVVEEAYGTKAKVDVASVKIAAAADATEFNAAYTSSSTPSASTAAKKGAVITLTGELKDSTLYKVTAANVKTAYGKSLSSTASETYTTFGGVAKPAADSLTYVVAPKSNTEVTLTFTNKLDKATAETVANYAVAKAYGDKAALAVTKATLSSTNSKVVTLTTAAQASELYKLTVTNVKDIYGNSIKTTSDANITSFGGQAVAAKITSVTAAVDSSDNTKLVLTFDQSVASDATDVSKYSIDNGIGYPNKAAISSSNAKVVNLTVPKTVEGKIYTITVKGLNNADGVAMATDGVKTTFAGKGVSATKSEIVAVMATDNQTLQVYFDRDVTDATIDGQIWDSSNNTLKSGALTIVNANALNSGLSYDLSLATEFAYQDATNKNVLTVRIATDNAFKTLLANQTVMKLTGATAKVVNTAALDFAPNTAEPTMPEIVNVMATDKKTIRVYFSQAIEDISKTANLTATKFTLAGAADGTNAIAVAVSSIVKIDSMTYDLVLAADLDSATTNVSNGKAFLRIATAGSTTFSGVNADYVTDKTGFVELKETATGVVAKEFGVSSTAVTADSIKDISILAKDKRTLQVYFPEKMNSTDVQTAANYRLVQNTTGTVAVTVLTPSYAVYNSTDNSVMLYFANDIANATTDGTTKLSNFYLAINGAVANAANLKTVKDEVTTITGGVYTNGLVRQFAISTTSVEIPKVASVSVSDDRYSMTVTFSKAVKKNGANDFGTADTYTAADVDSIVKGTAQFEGGSLAAFGAADIASGALSADHKELTITFKVKLAAGSTGTITTVGATANELKDRTGTAYAVTGDDAATLTFGVAASLFADTTAPLALAVADSTTSFKVVSATSITIKFNEKLDASKFTANAANGFAVAGGASALTKAELGADGVTVTLTGTGFVAATTTVAYTAGTLTDVSGVALATFTPVTTQ